MTAAPSKRPRRLPGLHEQIWETVRKIPRGKVATYGGIAKLNNLGSNARLVGYALHNVPPGSPIPWHRVINAKGRISFPRGSRLYKRQEALLKKEGVRFPKGKIDLERFGWPGLLDTL